MLALGNPLHAFDRAKLAEGAHRRPPRRGRASEIRTLDGASAQLDPRDLVIADAERPVAIAGIMGGEDSEVDRRDDRGAARGGELRAGRDPALVRAAAACAPRARAAGRRASTRTCAEQAAALATRAARRARGRALGRATTDVHGRRCRSGRVVALAAGAGRRRWSASRSPPRARSARSSSGSASRSTATSRARPDLARARRDARDRRRRGGRRASVLDRLPYTLPLPREMRGWLTREQRLRRARARTCSSARATRGVHVEPRRRPIRDPEAIRLPEPLSAEQAVLRTTLLPSLVEAARRNVDAGNDGIALFELARVYLPTGRAAAGGALAPRRRSSRAASRARRAPSSCSTRR